MRKKETDLHILLVEDESGHIELIRRALEGIPGKYIVAVASTIKEAQRLAAKQTPDLALVDYRLPDGQGDLIIALGKDSFPVIILTSHGDEQLAVQAIKAGALDYVAKSPESFETLPHIIDRALREWQLIQDGKVAEEALRESETHFRALFENASDGIIYLSLTTEIVQINNSFAKMHGYTVDEMKSIKLQDLDVDDLSQILPERMKQITNGEDLRFEVKHYHKDGHIIDLEVVTSMVTTKKEKLIVAFHRDITERKRSELSLAKFRQAIDTAGEAIFLTDKNGIFTYINPGFTALYGYTAEEVLGKETPRILKSGLLSTQVYEHFWKTITTEQEVKGEILNKRKDGSFITIDGSANAIVDDGKNIIGFLGIQRDISERKQAEKKLQSSESKHGKMVANIGDVIVIIDKDGINKYKSPNVEKWFGWKPEELVGFSMGKTIHPEDLEFAQKFIRNLLKEPNANGTAEIRYLCKDGNYKWIEFTGVNLLHDPDILGVLGNYQDISLRKKVEETLRESESKLKKAQHFAHIGSWTWNIKSNQLEWSEEMFRIFGIQKETFTGSLETVIANAIHPEDRSKVEQSNLSVLERQQPIPLEYRVILPDQTVHVVWAEAGEYQLDEEGKIIFLSGTVQDITERKLAEERLKASDTRYRELIETMPDGVYKSSHEGKFLEVNPAMVKILGYNSKEELLAIDIKTELYFKEEDRDSAALEEALKEMAVFRIKKKDGSEVWVEDNGRHVLDGEGNILYHEGILRDITERKKAEEALRQAQKMESIGTLAGGIAHDFNNLLVGILGQASLALKKLPKENPAVSNIMKSINASERAADLVRQLLAYSGKGKFFTVEIDLNSLVKENIQMLEVSIPKTAHLHYDLGSPSPHVNGDIGQIQQVIMNLIINAGESMGPNPGYITIKTNMIELTESNDEYSKYTNTPLTAGNYALLQVKDTGSGISQETLTRIFDPFFTTKFTGRGLGLAAVLGIIKSHRGGLRIESEIGNGTMFEIVLPLVTASKKADVQDEKKASAMEGEGKTILIIDDDPFVFQLLEDILTDVHFKVVGASDPLKGIELYRKEQQKISLVILDYSMPNMDGKKAFEELKKINNNVMVLLCSGYTEEETLSTFGIERPTGFFQKPYNTEALVEWVVEVLSDSRTIH